MSFTWLGLGAFVAGLAALAALLFALQRLRVRHREQTVLTTLFWREAIEETRARVFVQRFRHPWAYVLVLAISALMWLAVAGPMRSSAGEREHVLVVDASAGMGWGTRFADALSAARERASELPHASTRVVLAGSRCDTVLDFGEELPLFDRRTVDRRVETCPASVERVLEELFAVAAPRAGRSIELFGDARVDPALVALAPSGTSIARAELAPFTRAGNAGIVACGVSEAASGAWDRVDVFVEVAGDRTQDAQLALTLGGNALDGVQRTDDERGAHWIARDVAADGARLEARLTSSDAFALDDAAVLVIPDRPRIRVTLSPSVPATLRSVIESDSGVAIVDGDADVIVRASGESSGGDQPAIELVDEASQAAAFVVEQPSIADAELELRRAFEELGLDEVDSTALADQAGRPIELALAEAPRASVKLWSSLLGEQYDFAQSRACPLFFARAVRWLADVRPFAIEAAAGRRTIEGGAWSANSRTLDALGGELRWPRAGEWSSATGRTASVVLLDAGATRVGALESSLASIEAGSGSSFEWLPWIVLVAIALLALEWWLVRTERMP